MESKYAGYMGKVMLVDLSTETVTEYPWTDQERELYLGGKIMAARILCDHLTGKETPFSEENWMVISTGPLTGYDVKGKYASAKSAFINCFINGMIHPHQQVTYYLMTYNGLEPLS